MKSWSDQRPTEGITSLTRFDDSIDFGSLCLSLFLSSDLFCYFVRVTLCESITSQGCSVFFKSKRVLYLLLADVLEAKVNVRFSPSVE